MPLPGPWGSNFLSEHNTEAHWPNDHIYQVWAKSDENCRRSSLFSEMLTYRRRRTTTDEVGSVKLTWDFVSCELKSNITHTLTYVRKNRPWQLQNRALQTNKQTNTQTTTKQSQNQYATCLQPTSVLYIWSIKHCLCK